MSSVSFPSQAQTDKAERLTLALQRAASVLASKSWSIRKFANAFHAPVVPGEPPKSFDNQALDSLIPYVKRFTPFGEGLTGYESNDQGLDQFRFEFEDLGSGQLIARLYNTFSRPGETSLSETYLVSLVAESGAKYYGGNDDLEFENISNFELAFIGIDDQDGSISRAIGSFNLNTEIISMVENSKEQADRVAASSSILTSAPHKQDQLKAAEIVDLAQNSAAELLASQNWTFQNFANLLHDADLSAEPIKEFSEGSINPLIPYLERYDQPGHGFTSYELNQNGLDQLTFKFENLGSGQLLGRLYNQLQPGKSTLAETYLISVIADPEAKKTDGSDLSVSDIKNYELAYIAYEDFDGSQNGGIGSLNLDTGILSLVENSKSLASGVSATKDMILTSGEGEQKEEQAQILGFALEEAANYLADSTWSFQQFSKILQDTKLPDEPEISFNDLSTDALMPYVERFDVLPDEIISYDLNRVGLDQLRFEFDNIGSGQLIARLYSSWEPGDSNLAETYLVSLITDSENKDGGKTVDNYNNFELSFIGIEDNDGSQSIGIGSFNMNSGLLSLAESSKGFKTGITTTAEMILAANT